MKLEGRGAELLKIAEIAAHNSGGRIRLAHNEENKRKKLCRDAQHFLKFDGRRLGRDIELYNFMGEGPVGWHTTLTMFLEEVLLPLKVELPESYRKAAEALCMVGKSVYPKHLQKEWQSLFLS